MTEIDGRRVLVTGASAGLGEAIVRHLTTRGARVAGIATHADALDRLAGETGLLPFPADVRDNDAVTAAVGAAAEALGGLQALVNNAGTLRLGMVSDGDIADWRDMTEVNLLGLLATTKAAVPYLAASPGSRIVNISSMSGRRVPGPVGGVYSGTKHAVHAISEALRAELHDRGIQVTVISPGFVRTNYGHYITDPDIRQQMEREQRDQGLDPADVAVQVTHVLSAPPDVHLVEIALISARQSPG